MGPTTQVAVSAPGEQTSAGEPWEAVFYMDLLGGARSANAERSSVAAEQEGVVVVRTPLAILSAGTSVQRTVQFAGESEELAHRLRVELHLDSG